MPTEERNGGAPPGVIAAIDHVGIAVPDLDEAVDRYRRAFGMEPFTRDVVDDQGVEEALFRVGGSYIQLVTPLGPDTPVGRFLARRGEGIHHIGYRVKDVAETLGDLKAKDFPVVDDEPRIGSLGKMIAFVHPKALAGTLIELVQG